uniref:C2H2-type domain-containing protein n=1 Tax=Anopheles minimus TaxID=112268 RepID=A0A182WEQ5_9DIPT
MSRMPAKPRQPSVITRQPQASLDSVDLAAIAPSLASVSRLAPGGSAVPAAGIAEPLTGRSVDTFTSNPYSQAGVSAFTDGIYTADGQINPAFSEAVTDSAGRMMTDMIDEETVNKLEQRYAKAVDKITDIEMSAGQIALAGQSLNYLDGGGEEPESVMRQIKVEEFPDEVDAVEQVGQMATATEHMPEMELIKTCVCDASVSGTQNNKICQQGKMNFKCPLCELLFDTQNDLGEHVKEEHTTYYYDTYLLVPMVLNDLATIGTTTTTVFTTPPTVSVTDGADVADVETDGCCCCCGDDAGGGDDLCGCGELCEMCGCGGCCGCSGMCGCDECCDCGDCFGCGDCIGCGDCPSCCGDCSIM